MPTPTAHRMGHGPNLCSWPDRRCMASNMKTINRAASVEDSAGRQHEFERN